MQQRVRLPRCSSKAYQHGQQPVEPEQQQQPEEQQAASPEVQQQPAASEQQGAADSNGLVAALHEIKGQDAGSLLDGQGGGEGDGDGATLRCGALLTDVGTPAALVGLISIAPIAIGHVGCAAWRAGTTLWRLLPWQSAGHSAGTPACFRCLLLR